ncbi:MAG: sigma-70 family RNA polymerase sigma factor [Planctomycetota bacterium]
MEASSGENHRTLLLLARSGDHSAADQLLSMYQNYLRVLARTGLSRQVQSRVTISDVIQDTLLHAFKAISKFRGASREEFVVWIRTILASRIANAHEKHLDAERRDIRREVSIEKINENLSHSNMGLESIAVDHLQRSPSSVVAEAEEALLIADAIGTLPEEYQRVIVARHFDGSSFEQIAEQLGRSAGAVRMIWLRAIRRMRRDMKDLPP